MHPEGAASLLLNDLTRWGRRPKLTPPNLDHRELVSVGGEAGIRLAAAPGRALALDADDGSLGGLTLPRGMALSSDGLLYLLGPADSASDVPWIKQFDPAGRCFRRMRSIGGLGNDARQLRQPSSLAIAGGDLYVVDEGNRRVQQFDAATLALRHIWGPRDDEGRPVTPDSESAWHPVDVAAQEGTAYILDRRCGRVYRQRSGTDALVLVVDRPEAADRWSRIVVDREGRVYLLDADRGCLAVFERGRLAGLVDDPDEIRGRFDPPALRLDHRGRFCLPADLTRACDRRALKTAPPPERPLARCLPTPGAGPPCPPLGLIFDRAGRPARLAEAEPPGPPVFQRGGDWISPRLDSEIANCQWHRIDLDLSALPAGTSIEVGTYADARPRSAGEISHLPEYLWSTAYRASGETRKPGTPSNGLHTLLVQQSVGQYLWLRLRLAGDGYATPAVRSIRVHFPRDTSSYLGYLPAIYSRDDESRSFLERFLAVFQTEWDDLEARIEDQTALLDPHAVPGGPFLNYLAGWLGLPLEGTWDAEQRRRLLAATPKNQSRRGTIDGLRAYLAVYLQNITGRNAEALHGFPRIVEGFRERDRFVLSVDHAGRLGQGAPLWSQSVVGRLQLGVFAREGEVRLVSTGDPERDIFHEHAHRFRVFVPSAWVRTTDDETLIRRALDAEKPGHTSYDLCLIEPRFRVGQQSTVGLDTIVGDYPVARLACEDADDVPCARPPRHRLGFDTVLAGHPTAGPRLQVGAAAHIGIDTALT